MVSDRRASKLFIMKQPDIAFIGRESGSEVVISIIQSEIFTSRVGFSSSNTRFCTSIDRNWTKKSASLISIVDYSKNFMIYKNQLGFKLFSSKLSAETFEPLYSCIVYFNGGIKEKLQLN